MSRRIATANEFFDILSSMKGGCFATIGYVTGANLNLPKVKRKNPQTGRMVGYDDYETFGKELGQDGEIGGIVKLTSYTLNWSNPKNIANAYQKYKDNLNTIRSEYGLKPTQARESYKSTQSYGNNGISTYTGGNDDLKLHSYTAQNTHNARIKSFYYLIDTEGMVMREVNKDELLSYFKKKNELSGVKELRDMGETEERIQEYIDKVKNLKMSYQTFESSSILYMVATVNGEKIVYINENLSQCVKGVNIIPAEFTKIAKERYKIDYSALQEAIEEYNNNMLLTESEATISWFD